MQKTEIKLPTAPLRVQISNKGVWNETRPRDAADFFTIGYSGRTIDQFKSALTEAGVLCLIDVRANPVSMYKPDFSKKNLIRHLESVDIIYMHAPDLGVPRDIRSKAMNSGDLNDIWIWYDEYVMPTLSLHRFFNMADHPVAFMCTELDPTTCHRHRICLALEKNGLNSFDV